jgi:hypothetical protein
MDIGMNQEADTTVARPSPMSERSRKAFQARLQAAAAETERFFTAWQQSLEVRDVLIADGLKRRISRRDLAYLSGVSPRRLRQIARDQGMPKGQPGRPFGAKTQPRLDPD